MSFMKQDKEDRLLQRKLDMKERAKQREEDMKSIKEMINEVVNTKVLAAIKPVEEKLELQEKVNQKLYSELNSLTKELETLKQKCKSSKQGAPSVPEPQGHQGHHEAAKAGQGVSGEQSPVYRGVYSEIQDYRGVYSEKQRLCESARKIVGFSPIDQRMLGIQMQSYGAKDSNEAMLLEVKSFLKCEMKILPSEIEKLSIMRIFPPAKENWNVLYVEFESEKDVDFIFNHTSAMMKPDHRLMRWIPRQMFERFKAIQSIAYQIRKEEGLKTRVKIGQMDFQLSVRAPTSPRWCLRSLPSSLPEIELHQDPSLDLTPSGRPHLPSSRAEASTN